MGFFKRKKDEEAKIQLEREALEKLNGNNVDVFEIPEDYEANGTLNSNWQINGKTKAPHTITAEELNSKSQKAKSDSSEDCIAEEIPMSKSEKSNSSPTDFLFQKMMQSRAIISENTIEAAEDTEPEITNNNDHDNVSIQPVASSDKYTPIDIDAAIDDIRNLAKLNLSDSTENEDDVSSPDDSTTSDSDLLTSENSDKDTDKTANNSSTDTPHSDENVPSPEKSDDISNLGSNAEERRATLLARCNAYLEDDTGPIKADTEKYKLESVESILEGFETRAAERISKKFNVSSTPSAPIHTPQSQSSTPQKITDDPVVFKTPVTSTESTVSSAASSDPKQVKHIFTAPEGVAKPSDTVEGLSGTRVITDISSHSQAVDIYSSNKTTVFPAVEPVIDTSNSQTDTSETNDLIDDKEEKIHFEDYRSVDDRSKILKDLLHHKRSFTLKFLLTLFTFIPSLLILSPISNVLNITVGTANIIDLLVCLIMVTVNFGAVACISSLFTSKAKSGLPAALSLIAATVFSIINIIFKGELIGLSSVAAFSLLSYNLANRNFYSKTIKNFNIIANTEFKNAVSIVQNKNATKSIVDKAIEGSSLVCYGGETTNIHNFLRYTYCKNPISEKIQKLSLIGIIIGIGLALATLVLSSGDGILSVYIFASSVCYTAIPSVYHIVSLTINSANKRLNHYDAMITGYRAADELELCNAIAISSDALFPDGTIRLVDMKLLSPNPFDQSMLDAAAISSAIKSPIAGIFKQIDASKSYKISAQEVDSVIYEEKMGISGWVNDRRVFVGNRDLLIAHGFAGLPPAELDKKIMRKGFFPIYIASDNISCALLVVKYEPDDDIIYEMQRLANTGTTIIVDNCDPNINAKMLADYFELYSETIFVMSKQGSDFYRALTPHKEHRRAGAVCKSRIEGLLASLTASINIKKYVSRMSLVYICSIILGLLGLTTCIFTALNSLITPLNILIVQLIFTAVTLLPTVLRKP